MGPCKGSCLYTRHNCHTVCKGLQVCQKSRTRAHEAPDHLMITYFGVLKRRKLARQAAVAILARHMLNWVTDHLQLTVLKCSGPRSALKAWRADLHGIVHRRQEPRDAAALHGVIFLMSSLLYSWCIRTYNSSWFGPRTANCWSCASEHRTACHSR